MTITNHAATGALVAAAINRPWLSLPAALLSHFAVDIVPHWDYEIKSSIKMRNIIILSDLSLALYILLVLAVSVDASQRLIIAGGVLAVIPDLMWARYKNVDFPSTFPKNSLMGRLRSLHDKMQWSETSWGKYIEVAWLVLVLVLIFQL